MTLVTILLAARDRPELLAEALASALDQDWPELEVLVVDDGSGTPTCTLLDGLAAREDRLRVLHTPAAGVAAARARGVEQARGEIIVVLDSDDRLLPGAVARLVAALDAAPAADLVYGDVVELHPDGRETCTPYQRFADPRQLRRAVLTAPRVPFKHSGMVLRRAAALAVGSYDATLPAKVDIDLMLRFLAAGRPVRHAGGAPVAVFRLHGGSLSRRRWLGVRTWARLIDLYGPANPAARLALKVWRAGAEGGKALYELLLR